MLISSVRRLNSMNIRVTKVGSSLSERDLVITCLDWYYRMYVHLKLMWQHDLTKEIGQIAIVLPAARTFNTPCWNYSTMNMKHHQFINQVTCLLRIWISNRMNLNVIEVQCTDILHERVKWSCNSKWHDYLTRILSIDIFHGFNYTIEML